MRKQSTTAYVSILLISLSARNSTQALNSEPQSTRRSWLSKVVTRTVVPSLLFTGGLAQPSVADEEDDSAVQPRKIVKLLSGVQYTDARVGHGPEIEKSGAVVMHLRALLRDGSVLFDTAQDGNGSPLLYQLGSAQDFDFFGGDSSKRSKVVPGVEDAILSRGQLVPMRQGGIRMVVVPSPLGYGNAGVSRYDAFRMGLRKAVPRDELLRYEIELLRCIEVELPGSGGRTTLACCTEDNYPCNTSTESPQP